MILPTRCCLEKKVIQEDTECSLCFNEKEEQEYRFMKFPTTQQVWFLSPMGIYVPNHINLISWMQIWLSTSIILAT